MGRLVTIGNGYMNVSLPNNLTYSGGQSVTLTDEQWAQVNNSLIGTVVIDGGPTSAVGGDNAVVVTTTAFANNNDLVLSDPQGSQIAVLAPSEHALGMKFTVKNIGATGRVQVVNWDGELIEGAAGLTLFPGECVTLVADGATWRVI
jgi:hypothetical protein